MSCTGQPANPSLPADSGTIAQFDYLKYIASVSWRTNPVRLREFEAAGFQCRLCPHSTADGYPLEAHHRTYARLGNEADGDLTALCRECHLGVTSMLRARRYLASLPHELRDCFPEHARPEPLFDPPSSWSKSHEC